MDATVSSARGDGAVHRPAGLWFVLLGLILGLCGIFSLLAPIASTLALAMILALAAGIAGIAQIIQAFGTRTWRGFLLNLLVGVVYAVGGVVLWLNPLAGALTLSMIVAFFLIAGGIGEILLAFAIRGEAGWFWLILSGIIGVVAGIWLLYRMPLAGLAVPGIALGIALLMEGGAFVAIGLRRGPRADAEAAHEPAAAERS